MLRTVPFQSSASSLPFRMFTFFFEKQAPFPLPTQQQCKVFLRSIERGALNARVHACLNRLQEDHTFSRLPLGPRFPLLVHGKGAGSPAAQVGLRTTLLDRCARRRGELLIPTRFQQGGKDSGYWCSPACGSACLRVGVGSSVHPRLLAAVLRVDFFGRKRRER